jgi:hypothetical protein
MKVDVLCGEPQFIDHIAPVYLALPKARRGAFIVRRGASTELTLDELDDRARLRGVEPSHEGDASRPILVASWGDYKRVRGKREHIIRMEHGIGQSFLDITHPSYAGGNGSEAVGLFLTPNEHSADRWRRAYPETPVAVVGSPHLDALPKRKPGPGPVIAISFHWGSLPSRRSPIAEQFGSFYEYAPMIRTLSRHFTVLGHGHPRDFRRFARLYRRAGIEPVRDFHEVLERADVYVCDTNSTLFEFASTGRPVVVVNGRHFRRDVEHGLRFWEASGVGVNCDSPADLVPSIRAALDDHHQAERERALGIVYAHRKGSAKRAAKAIGDWLDERYETIDTSRAVTVLSVATT